MPDNTRLPEWAEDTEAFASRVVEGKRATHDGMVTDNTKIGKPKTKQIDIEPLIDGIKKGNRALLARGITLVESSSPLHKTDARELLKALLPLSGKSVRIGITGVPGAGKSSFIETLGLMLTNKGHKVAVLAVDPSSTVTKGSILGDKTRMGELIRHENVFVRPSPSGGTLGGVAAKSRETMILCEAAGYDIILVETVGVGQSEVTVRSMVDMFLLITLTGAGDELQGIKKGVMELADLVLVNKADGDNLKKAQFARADYEQVIHYLRPATEGWSTPALTCSALTGEGINELWTTVENFFNIVKSSGIFKKRRTEQAISWVRQMVEEHLYRSFFENENVKAVLPEVDAGVRKGLMTTAEAVEWLLESYR